MVFLVGGANSATGYEISNSLRLSKDSATNIYRDFSGTGTLNTKGTFSWWCKIYQSSNDMYMMTVREDATPAEHIHIRYQNPMIQGQFYESSSQFAQIITNDLFRDHSAWYHFVLKMDSTDGTANNRIRFFVNNQEVSYATQSMPDQNQDFIISKVSTHLYGNTYWGTGNHLDGGLADVHFIDGQAKDPTDFGKTNDNGVWIPKKYEGTYGDHGYKLEFKQTGTSANSSGIGADTSGNDNHFAVSNLTAIDVTTDTPTNNFCTLNPIDKAGNGAITFSEGNLKAAVEDNGNARGNFFVNSGKWYWETLIVSGDSVATVGIAEPGFYSGNLFDSSSTAKGYIYINNGQKRSPAGSASSYGDSYADDDIIGVALNMDDGEVKFYKNNTVQNSGTAAFTSLSGDHGIYYQGYGGTATVILNTGHDSSFAGNKTAQNNTDGNGYGDFYYSPPSGFYALCTKNLAEYG